MRQLISALFVIFAVLFIPVAASAQSLNNRAEKASGVVQQSIMIDGLQRSYYVHFPPVSRTPARLPLVLVLHGGGRGNGLTPARYMGFTALADREHFIVAYPNGVDAFWRDGRDLTFRGDIEGRVDDVAYISALIDRFVHQYHVDPKRVYVTGISNGGMMTLRLGCELSAKLAAIAPIAANIPRRIYKSCQPAASLPVLVMNGTADPLVPYDGGDVRFFRQRRGKVVSTQETVLFWRQQNQCRGMPETRQLPDRDTGDSSRVTRTIYGSSCLVELYTVIGGGHTLPGSDLPDLPRILGQKNRDIDGAAVIWTFFKNHSR